MNFSTRRFFLLNKIPKFCYSGKPFHKVTEPFWNIFWCVVYIIGGYDKKYWSFPYSEDILRKILSVFVGERINIDSSLQRLVKETPESKDFEDLRRELVSRKYSPKTIKIYSYYNRDILKLANKSPSDIIDSDIKDYLFYLVEKKKVVTSTLNIAINALKFYFWGIFKNCWDIRVVKLLKSILMLATRV